MLESTLIRSDQTSPSLLFTYVVVLIIIEIIVKCPPKVIEKINK